MRSEVVQSESSYRPVAIVNTTILRSNLVCLPLVALIAIGIWLGRWTRPLVNRFHTSSYLMTLVNGSDSNETGIGLQACRLINFSGLVGVGFDRYLIFIPFRLPCLCPYSSIYITIIKHKHTRTATLP